VLMGTMDEASRQGKKKEKKRKEKIETGRAT
jgi:hypothetical protein